MMRVRRVIMHAVIMREFGPPEVLEPAAVAGVRAGPGEVVIDVEVANVTFVETQVRAGKPPHPAMLPALPAILGNGVGGTVAEVGADVDSSYGDWPRRVRDAVGHVDVVFDGVGGDIGLAAFDLLGPDGRFCPFGMASGSFAPVTPELAQARQITVLSGTALSPEALRALTQAALTEAAAGHIRPVIGQELDLTQAAPAHAEIEARATIGKTLLTVPR